MGSDIEVLRSFIRDTFGHTDFVADDQDLLSTGILDSFNVVEIALFIQQEFKIELEGDDISRNNFMSLDRMIALIQRHQG